MIMWLLAAMLQFSAPQSRTLLGVEPTPPVAMPLGEFRCTGTVKGAPYVTALQVEAFGDALLFVWYDDKGSTIRGYGVRHEDTVAVALINVSNGALGVAAYAVSRDALVGTWGAGDDRAEPERCVRVASREA